MERNMRLLLLSVAFEASKTMAQSTDETKESDLAILILTVTSFAIFVMGLASVCYRWSSRQFHSQEAVNPFTDSDVESRTSITEARGIDADVVKTFPTFLYSEVKERRIGRGGVECVVCLCEFEDDETLRLMPNCCHVFHADCVSVWLTHHSTCPLCRVNLFFQPGERSDLIPGSELDGVTWNNRNRPSRSHSTRILSHCGVSEILLSRSHSTGHSVVQSVENLDRFTLRLPENVRRQLTKKTVDHVALTQVKSLRRSYRSRSAGSERSLFSYQRNSYNSRRLHSMTFSFPDSVWSTSVPVAPPKSRSGGSAEEDDEPSFERFQPDDQV